MFVATAWAQTETAMKVNKNVNNLNAILTFNTSFGYSFTYASINIAHHSIIVILVSQKYLNSAGKAKRMGEMPVSDFSLAHTLDSGQFFRYVLHDGWYYIVSREKVFRARQEGSRLFFEGASAGFVRHFFGLDGSYLEIMHQLSKDPVLRLAIKKYPGLRLTRQDPWECTVGFLCSQFSNIKKIRKNMECIAEKFGKMVVFRGKRFFAFPSPGSLKDVAKLKKCAVGFRAKYIAGVNAKVSDKWFAKLKQMSYFKAKEKLMGLPGIGEKVADCICLFSLGFTESFPVDVWMERVIKEKYVGAKKAKLSDLADFGRKKWGKMAGYAQQYLYHWRRLHGKLSQIARRSNGK